ncbi:MAG: hypothetical protein ACRDOB_00095 [Streptosporangiaceae bacterium]
MSEPEGRGDGHTTHPDSDVLAEFRAGLVTGRRGKQVAAHLAACDRCTALDRQLAEVGSLLAAAPPPALPDGLAERLDTVLAAELARQDEAERAGAGQSGHPVKRPRPAGNGRWRLVALRMLAPAAAIVVLAAGGYGLSRLSSSPSSSTTASRPVPAASSAHARPAIGAGGGSVPRPAFMPSRAFDLYTSSTDFQRATLGRQLAAEVVRPAATRPPQTPPAQLVGCVNRVTQKVSPGTPRLVENARFQGQPATVIVARSGAGYRAWMLAPGCSASSYHVLDTTTLPGISAP